MSSQTFFILFIPLLAFILLAINVIFAPHNPYQEKDSVFECGFHSFLGQNRSEFSISFFIFALLFLLFDLEILLVYPFIVSIYVNGLYGLIIMLVFFLVLTLGFAFELGKNALSIESKQVNFLKTRFNLKTNTTSSTGMTMSISLEQSNTSSNSTTLGSSSGYTTTLDSNSTNISSPHDSPEWFFVESLGSVSVIHIPVEVYLSPDFSVRTVLNNYCRNVYKYSFFAIYPKGNIASNKYTFYKIDLLDKELHANSIFYEQWTKIFLFCCLKVVNRKYGKRAYKATSVEGKRSYSTSVSTKENSILSKDNSMFNALGSYMESTGFKVNSEAQLSIEKYLLGDAFQSDKKNQLIHNLSVNSLGGNVSRVINDKSEYIYLYIDKFLNTSTNKDIMIEILNKVGKTFIYDICVYTFLKILTHSNT